MTTVLAVYNSDGCVGRCDASCYMAKTPKCRCICGGRNHSAGQERAIENVRNGIGSWPDDLERFATARQLRCEELIAVNRLDLNNDSARKWAWMKLHQLDLPFE